MLLERGAKVDIEDGLGWTPLMIASSAGSLEIVDMLIKNGASVNHVNNKGQASLHYAASKNHATIAHLLLEKGADVNVKDKANQHPLHRAATTGNGDIIKLLISPPNAQHKTRLNTADRLGNTPLHLAMESGHASTAIPLINAGADRERQNFDQQTPLEIEGVGGQEQRRVVDSVLQTTTTKMTKPENKYEAKFEWHDRSAHDVHLQGSFTGWMNDSNIPLKKGQDGVWRASHYVTYSAKHQYRYKVNGEWKIDPRVESSHGSPLNVLVNYFFAPNQPPSSNRADKKKNKRKTKKALKGVDSHGNETHGNDSHDDSNSNSDHDDDAVEHLTDHHSKSKNRVSANTTSWPAIPEKPEKTHAHSDKQDNRKKEDNQNNQDKAFDGVVAGATEGAKKNTADTSYTHQQEVSPEDKSKSAQDKVVSPAQDGHQEDQHKESATTDTNDTSNTNETPDNVTDDTKINPPITGVAAQVPTNSNTTGEDVKHKVEDAEKNVDDVKKNGEAKADESNKDVQDKAAVAKQDAEKKEAQAKQDAEKKAAQAKQDEENKAAQAKQDADKKTEEAKNSAAQAKQDADKKAQEAKNSADQAKQDADKKAEEAKDSAAQAKGEVKESATQAKEQVNTSAAQAQTQANSSAAQAQNEANTVKKDATNAAKESASEAKTESKEAVKEATEKKPSLPKRISKRISGMLHLGTMKIAIDFDDVISQTNRAICEWHNRVYGTQWSMDEFHYYHYWKNPGWGTPAECQEKVRAFYSDPKGLHSTQPVAGVKEALLALQAQGHDLVIVTARSRSQRAMTTEWLSLHLGGLFDELYFVGQFEEEKGEHYGETKEEHGGDGETQEKAQDQTQDTLKHTSKHPSKADIIDGIDAEVLIDDSLENALECARHTRTRGVLARTQTPIRTLLFSPLPPTQNIPIYHYPWNVEVSRVDNQLDRLSYAERRARGLKTGESREPTQLPQFVERVEGWKGVTRWFAHANANTHANVDAHTHPPTHTQQPIKVEA
ncbi:hypothetical protein E3P89_02780 [Wallemia ichthyophaga]|uniref:AMP-activated protein kinase glycogen-binding domain-containing protein n=1 Tax=Wallemia ichthyophaga TaxID=245174 RepID=A0A4T0I167_WALIC|nr:hypothetical protein E3P90_02796 [Wallemia ichthyophaga]TIB10614.1 hypothetical protein E3P93_02804 [Wallemia ichthyophaga]TIB21142.1 hypothetical protein E3P89_02780 [Wallemia ichthyophaga]TIB22790.1 hypothetical protein E3P88_02815 [Wallemia ichthyophaga]